MAQTFVAIEPSRQGPVRAAAGPAATRRCRALIASPGPAGGVRAAHHGRAGSTWTPPRAGSAALDRGRAAGGADQGPCRCATSTPAGWPAWSGWTSRTGSWPGCAAWSAPASGPSGRAPARAGRPGGRRRGAAAGRRMAEREVIKAALQLPEVVGQQFDELGPQAFLVAVHQQLQAAIAAAGGATAAQPGPVWPARWPSTCRRTREARHAVNALAVEPLRAGPDRIRPATPRRWWPAWPSGDRAARSPQLKSRCSGLDSSGERGRGRAGCFGRVDRTGAQAARAARAGDRWRA